MNRKILLTGDMEICECFSLMLSDKRKSWRLFDPPFDPIYIENGWAAVEWAEEHQPAIIIVDHFGIGTREIRAICHALKTDESTKHIPLIVDSAFSDFSIRYICDEFDFLLVNPPSDEEFQKIIGDAVEWGDRNRPARPSV